MGSWLAEAVVVPVAACRTALAARMPTREASLPTEDPLHQLAAADQLNPSFLNPQIRPSAPMAADLCNHLQAGDRSGAPSRSCRLLEEGHRAPSPDITELVQDLGMD